MANARGMGLKYNKGYLVRFTKDEKRLFNQRARDSGLSKSDFARCKLLDIPLEALGGRAKRGRPPKVEPPVASAPQATI